MNSLDCLLELEQPSFASLCLDNSPQVRSKTYNVPIYDILPEHSIHLIQTEQFSELPNIYHNLMASPEAQKRAMLSNLVSLSPWELLCFTLFKALTTQTPLIDRRQMHLFSFDGGELHPDDSEEVSNFRFVHQLMRMDKNRMVLIVLVRLLKRLILEIGNSFNPLDSPLSARLTQFCQIADEFIMQPVIFGSRMHKQSF